MKATELNQRSKKAAIEAAVDYLKEILNSKDPLNIKLEEIDQTDDGRYWLITLSYDDITLENIFEDNTRTYKVFKIDKTNNEVHSMKLRDYEYRRSY